MCISVHQVCAWCLKMSKEDAGFPRAGVRDGYRHHMGAKS